VDDQFHRLTFELLLILFLYLFLFHGSLHFTLSFRVRQIGGASEGREEGGLEEALAQHQVSVERWTLADHAASRRS